MKSSSTRTAITSRFSRSVLCATLLAQAPCAWTRSWTFRDGEPPMEADFVEFKSTTVVMDRGNNSLVELPFDSFSFIDKQFIREVSKSADPAGSRQAKLPKQKGNPEVADTLVPGTVVSRVARGDAQISYHVYIPTTFRPDDPPPIIIAFHPGGKGLSILNSMKASAEKAGWLLVGCDKLRNGIKDDVVQDQMEDEVMDDIRASLPHDPNRIYLAGMSGGAMRAYLITNRLQLPFAGIIAYGGWLGGPEYQAKRFCPNMAVAAINGERDAAARAYVKSDAESLKRSRCTQREFVWPGGHQIASTGVTDEAIAWLEEEYKKRQ